MLRNTIVWAAHTLAKQQCIRKCGGNTLKRLINTTPIITDKLTTSALTQVKSFSTNVPNLQKEE